MHDIEKPDLPADALLQKYATMEGAYTDCYSTEVNGAISLADFVTAFYTTPLFKLERFALKYAVSKPSTDSQARELGAAQIDAFAAWTVEHRENNQLLMCDYQSRTRSWLMVAPQSGNGQNTTRLFFGTAVTPLATKGNQKPSIGFAFHAMLGFHKIYSVALLSAAGSRLNGFAPQP